MKLNSVVRYVPACDISYWQGELDAKKMKSAGISACIVRAGYGQTIDKRFVSYINSLIDEGIQVGVYWFIYARTTAIAKANAEKCIEVIAPYKDYLTAGVWADWEYDSDKNVGSLTTTQRCNIVQMFLSTLEAAGYDVGIYSNQDYIKNGKFSKELIATYPLWYARYNSSLNSYSKKGRDGAAYVWQYSSSGRGSDYGVESATIDLDNCYIDLSYDRKVSVVDKVTSDNTAISASDNPYPVPTRALKYVNGQYIMRGDDVKWVQWHLWRFGLFVDANNVPDASEIDGCYGNKTATAVQEAQKRLGLTVDGIVGKNTRTKFQEV